MNEITVYVYKPADRTTYLCEWTDPVTGKRRRKSTGTAPKRDADRFAGKLEDDLQAGRFKDTLRISWAESKDRYDQEVLTGKAEATAKKVFPVFSAVERHINPATLAALDAGQISKLASGLRKEK